MKAAVTTEEHGFEVVDLPDPVPGPRNWSSVSPPAASAGPTSRRSRSRRPEW